MGIAAMVGLDPNTIYSRCKEDLGMSYSEFQASKKAEGVELLRTKQFDMAMKGNTTMAIWLGKQYINQRDAPMTTEAPTELVIKIEAEKTNG